MNIIKGLYSNGFDSKALNKNIRRVKHNKAVNDLYVVTLPLFGDGLLEVYSYRQLLQPFYKKRSKDITIIGMSSDREGAETIILNLVQAMYDAKAKNQDVKPSEVSFDVRDFLKI